MPDVNGNTFNTHILLLKKNGTKRLQIVKVLQTVNRPMNPSDSEIIYDIINYNFPSWELLDWNIAEDCHEMTPMLIGEDYQIEV